MCTCIRSRIHFCQFRNPPKSHLRTSTALKHYQRCCKLEKPEKAASVSRDKQKVASVTLTTAFCCELALFLSNFLKIAFLNGLISFLGCKDAILQWSYKVPPLSLFKRKILQMAIFFLQYLYENPCDKTDRVGGWSEIASSSALAPGSRKYAAIPRYTLTFAEVWLRSNI